jgi:hypothetical protein
VAHRPTCERVCNVCRCLVARGRGRMHPLLAPLPTLQPGLGFICGCCCFSQLLGILRSLYQSPAHRLLLLLQSLLRLRLVRLPLVLLLLGMLLIGIRRRSADEKRDRVPAWRGCPSHPLRSPPPRFGAVPQVVLIPCGLRYYVEDEGGLVLPSQ